jgi:ribonucleoside-diphosphate reductase alpha chain
MTIPEEQSDDRLDLSANARTVLERRYLRRGPDGTPVETPAQLFHRVAADIASVEGEDGRAGEFQARFFKVMAERRFLPNSPTLMNAGRELEQLSACFVLPIGDSMEEIFETLKHAAIIHKSGGGTGFSFSALRPRDDTVASTSGIASGPVSFMAVYDAATEHVKQGGTRRGANMGILRYDHPDIFEFIECKTSGDDAISNFNISVAVDAAFMEAVNADASYDLVNPRDNSVAATVRARDVFERIVRSAWRSGDPGLVFIDRMNEPRTNPTPLLGSIEATNPCGEQPLLPYESCNLGSINLDRFVCGDGVVWDSGPVSGRIDWDSLRDVVHLAVRFLDDVIERSAFPLPQIEQLTRGGNRKIGLGVMGWADMLVRLGIPYDSAAALDLAGEVMGFVQAEADAASAALAEARGNFPNWALSIYGEAGKPMRNATRTTIAPTGTISIIAGCSSGIEPLFALAYHRNVLDGSILTEVHPLLSEVAATRGFNSPDVLAEIARRGSLRGVAAVPDDVQRVFVTAHDITPEAHVRMQAAFQAHCDNAVSKTVNFARTATPADVEHVFKLAYELGCKGITIYRDGSKSSQVLNVGTPPARAMTGHSVSPLVEAAPPVDSEFAAIPPRAPSPPASSSDVILPRPVPDEGSGLPARRFRVPTPLGTMNVFVTEVDAAPFEVFVVFGKAGSDLTAMSEAIGRLISLALRSGIPVGLVVDQLRGIGGRSSIGFGDKRVLSVVDALAKVLEDNYPASGPARPHLDSAATGGAGSYERPRVEICPDCLEYAFEFAEGCGKCHACGFSSC